MLVRYSLSNFRSFDYADENTAEDGTIIFTKGGSRAKPDHVVHVESNNISLLRSTVVFGANAAGKSNLIKGIGLVKKMVTNDPIVDRGSAQYCKCFSTNRNRPVRFEFDILVDDTSTSVDLEDSEDLGDESLFGSSRTLVRYTIELSYAKSATPVIIHEKLTDASSELIYERRNSDDAQKTQAEVMDLYRERHELLQRKRKLLTGEDEDKADVDYSINSKKVANDEADLIWDLASRKRPEDSGEKARQEELRWIDQRLSGNRKSLDEKRSMRSFGRGGSFLSANPDFEMLKDTGVVGSAYEKNPKQLKRLVEALYLWFDCTLEIIDPFQFTIPQLDSESFDELSKTVAGMDLGIKELRWTKVDDPDEILSVEQGLSEVSGDAQKVRDCKASSIKGKIECSVVVGSGRKIYRFAFWHGKLSLKRLVTVHKDEKEHDLSEESDGTRRIIELSSILVDQGYDKVYVVDELNRRLHPLLVRHFMDVYFASHRENGSMCQLIMTTHETRLLTTDLLRMDEVWFVEHDDNGCSRIYPATDMGNAINKHLDRLYLEDKRFGGVPRIRDDSPSKGAGSR